MKDQIIALTQELVRRDSSNPPGKEKDVADFIRAYLARRGARTKTYEFKKDRPNIVCELTSVRRKKKILITPHIDVVPAAGTWRYPPFSAKLSAGKIYGRGATDDKANVAVALYVIGQLVKRKKLENIDLVFAFTADEETGSDYGLRPLLSRLRGIDYGLVLDSNEFDMIVAQKGLLHLRVEILGKEAHGAYPDRGVSAVEQTVRVVEEILRSRCFEVKHPFLKKATLNVGRIAGGDKVNIVAGRCMCELDIRYVPPMKKEKIISEIEKIIRRQTRRYKITVLAHQCPVEIETKHFLVGQMKKVLKKKKIRARCKPSFGATVLTFLTDRGIDSFAFGFGSSGCAHSINEYVKVSNLVKGADVLEEYLLRLDRYFDEH